MFQRDIENWYKFNFEGVGRYGVPALLPEYIETKYFIPFNYAKSCKDPDQCGVHFFYMIINLKDFGICRKDTRV